MFKPGQSGNPEGGQPRSISKIKWELIDSYIADGTKWAFEILDGTNSDVVALKGKDRLEIQSKAFGHLVKLAPQRQQHSGPDGGPIETKEHDPMLDALAKEYEEKLKVQMVRNTWASTGPTTTVTMTTSLPEEPS
jgi:hypothetical protein